MKARMNAYDTQGAPIMRTGTIGQFTDPAPVCARPKGEKMAITIMDEAATVGLDYGAPGFVVKCCRCGEMRPPMLHEVFKTTDGEVVPFSRSYCADCFPVVAMEIDPRTLPKPKRPSLREVALSVLARLANSGRREW